MFFFVVEFFSQVGRHALVPLLPNLSPSLQLHPNVSPHPSVRHLLSIPLAIGRFNTGSQSGSYFELFSKEGKLHKETSLFVSGFTLSFIFSLSEVNGSSGGKKITKAVYFRKSPNPSD